MAYEYTCHACGITSEPSTMRSDARTVQQRHRDAAHHGHAPTAGDGVHHVTTSMRGPAAVIAAVLLWALIDSVARWIGRM